MHPFSTYEEMCHEIVKIENQSSKTTFPLSRNVVTKPQVPTYKTWPNKDDTPKVAFKDIEKPKVEENGRLVANPIPSGSSVKECDIFLNLNMECARYISLSSIIGTSIFFKIKIQMRCFTFLFIIIFISYKELLNVNINKSSLLKNIK